MLYDVSKLLRVGVVHFFSGATVLLSFVHCCAQSTRFVFYFGLFDVSRFQWLVFLVFSDRYVLLSWWSEVLSGLSSEGYECRLSGCPVVVFLVVEVAVAIFF